MSINKQFINALQKWIQYDDLIKEKNDELKSIKDSNELLENNIINYIENYNLSDTKLTLNGNNIYLNVNTISNNLSFKLIEEALLEYLKNEYKVKKICEVIKLKKDENKKESKFLKRKIIKKKKTKSHV